GHHAAVSGQARPDPARTRARARSSGSARSRAAAPAPAEAAGNRDAAGRRSATQPAPPGAVSGEAREIRRVGVLGFGLMGSGIAQACAASGYDTIAHEPLAAARDKGQAAVERSLGKLAEKDVITAGARDAALARLSVVDDLDALGGCDLVIEAVTEDLEVKNALWRELDGRCAEQAIFASNTSSLTIAAMAAATTRLDRFIGLHFFNPVPLMPLVEVVRTVGTSDATVARMHEFVRSLGKQPVAAKDASGFIVNLLLVPYLLDAVR